MDVVVGELPSFLSLSSAHEDLLVVLVASVIVDDLRLQLKDEEANVE